jgi:hypothetical protein
MNNPNSQLYTRSWIGIFIKNCILYVYSINVYFGRPYVSVIKDQLGWMQQVSSLTLPQHPFSISPVLCGSYFRISLSAGVSAKAIHLSICLIIQRHMISDEYFCKWCYIFILKYLCFSPFCPCVTQQLDLVFTKQPCRIRTSLLKSSCHLRSSLSHAAISLAQDWQALGTRQGSKMRDRHCNKHCIRQAPLRIELTWTKRFTNSAHSWSVTPALYSW